MKQLTLLLGALLTITLHTACEDDEKYWINNHSNKTHNRSCKYYENCDGHYSATGSGDDCRICGGESEE
jgi:hypothetical protein